MEEERGEGNTRRVPGGVRGGKRRVSGGEEGKGGGNRKGRLTYCGGDGESVRALKGEGRSAKEREKGWAPLEQLRAAVSMSFRLTEEAALTCSVCSGDVRRRVTDEAQTDAR